MNKRMKLTLLAAFALLGVTAAEASWAFQNIHDGNSVVGPITRIQGHWVSVQDEKGIDTYRFFVHTEQLKEFQTGDRVRVYFRRDNDLLISIKKMTLLDCGEKQNLGIVSGCGKSGNEDQ